MRYFRAIIFVTITIASIIIFSSHHPFGTPLPALGRLVSPYNGFWKNAESSALPNQKAIVTPSLTGKGEIVYDKRLVPHIFAQNLNDATFLQGYVTARYRLWQMDISVRATAGFLSEVLGERTLQHDIKKRRKGLLFAAEQLVQRWQETGEIDFIQSYCDGINLWISSLSPDDYPIEYKLMDFKPTLWTPLKSAIFLKSMTETLAFHNSDVRASNALKAFEPELFNFLYPPVNHKAPPVIPAGTSWNFTPTPIDSTEAERWSMLQEEQLPPLELFEPMPEGIGSNNWAVSGRKTKSGRPIFCNDPHLPLSLPSIWFEIQIKTPELNAYGASLPGLPGVAIGFNEDIAWGETNGGIDVLDWYTIEWVDDAKTKYTIDGTTKTVKVRKEVIPIRGQSNHIEKVKYTEWGPIVHDEKDSPYYDLAMHWIGLETPKDDKKTAVSTFLGLMKAKNYEDYRKALKIYDSPIQNFAFACKDGDIAITVNGKIPVRRPSQGRFIQAGNTSQNKWQSYVPMDQVPAIRNPERGFIFSANQRSASEDYPYPIVGRFADYRCRIINDKLSKMEKITPSDMMKMQTNTYSLKAAELLPLLLDAQREDTTSQIIRDLKDWDLHFTADSKAAFIFEKWAIETYRMTFDEVYALRDSMSILFPDSWRLIELIEREPSHPIFDNKQTTAIENATDIIQQAYRRVKMQYEASYADDDFNWSNQKSTHINHLAQIPPFSAQKIKIGGHHNSINAVQNSFGPSWRMVVALGEQPKAWGVYPGGQSGNPGSKFYDNMISQWANGEYNQLLFMQSAAGGGEEVVFRQEFGK